MIAAVLTAAGCRTGLFTSPHLERIEERIALDGQPCNREDFDALIAAVRLAVEALDRAAAADQPAGQGPTYFEILTAMAWLHFARRRAAAAVLEVGLGGRLDSTNVCRPSVGVITSISFDHTRQLGDTLAAIAGEKAGIVKPGVPVVSGVTADEPRAVIRAACRAQASPLLELGADFDFDYRPPRGLERGPAAGRLTVRFRQQPQWSLDDVPLGLAGRHQAANAALAVAAVRWLGAIGPPLPGVPADWEPAVRAALASLAWPARVEVVARQPTVVLDAAHNVASIEALLATLDESFSTARRLAVFGVSQDKDAAGMVRLLAARCDRVFLTRYTTSPRAVPVEELLALVPPAERAKCVPCADPPAAWQAVARVVGPDDLVCVTGSFYLAAEMRRLAGELRCSAHGGG
jgi:dihydrofolate synthase/folylpolyglutamate synthase